MNQTTEAPAITLTDPRRLVLLMHYDAGMPLAPSVCHEGMEFKESYDARRALMKLGYLRTDRDGAYDVTEAGKKWTESYRAS